MPKLDPKLPLPGEEAIQLGLKYTVAEVEEFTSDVHGFVGYRVTLDGGEGNQIAIPLWYSEIASRTSKLGAFMVALGEEIKKWKGRTIVFLNWQEREREVQAVI